MKTGCKRSAIITCVAVACATLGTLSQPVHAGYWQASTVTTDYFYGSATQTTVAEIGPNAGDDNEQPVAASQTSWQIMNFVKEQQTDVPQDFLGRHAFTYSWAPTIQNWVAYGYGQAKCTMDAGFAGGTWTISYASNGAITGDTPKSGSNIRNGTVACGGNSVINVTIPFTVSSHARAQVSNGFTGSATVTSASTKTTISFSEMW